MSAYVKHYYTKDKTLEQKLNLLRVAAMETTMACATIGIGQPLLFVGTSVAVTLLVNDQVRPLVPEFELLPYDRSTRAIAKLGDVLILSNLVNSKPLIYTDLTPDTVVGLLDGDLL